MSFPAYPDYKDSGVEWLGAVPSHWGVAALKRHVGIVGGSTPKSDVAAYWDGDIPWVTPADLSKLSDFWIIDTLRKITPDGLASCGTTLVAPGSIILSTRAPIGSLGIADVALCTNQGCKALVPKGIESNYLAYLLSISSAELNVRGRGSTFLELSADDLGAFPVPFPPTDEQAGVVAFLDRETAKIDALVAEQERLIALLKEKRQAVISHAVTKGLNPAAPMMDSGIEWLGEVPAHWKIERAKNVFTKSALPPPPGSEVVTCFRDGQVTLRKNRREDGFTMAVLEVGYQGIQPGQLVLHSMDAFAGAIGVSDSEGKCSPEYLVCDPASEGVNTNYYGQILRLMASRGFILAMCPSVRERAPRIRFPDFGDMLLPMPPRTEQDDIVATILRADGMSARLMRDCTDAIRLLQERRAALISAAVTGKIDVRGLVHSSREMELA